MGQKNSTKTSIKNEIENEISTTIKNTTENITNIVNKVTSDVSTTMTKSASTSIRVNTSGSNRTNVDDILAKSSDIDIEQTAEVQSENLAIIKIMQSTEAMTEMANKIASTVKNTTANDAVVAASLKQAAAIGQATKDAGGPEAFVKKITDDVNRMIGELNVGGSNTTDTNIQTTIKNKIKTNIENTTINESNISNSIDTNIKNSMSLAAEAKCDMNTSAGNEIDVEKILATIQDGERSKISVKQSVSLKAFNKCFIDLNMGSKIVNTITGEASAFIKNDTVNNVQIKAQAEQTGAISTSSATGSGISDMGNKLIGADKSPEVVKSTDGGTNNTGGGTNNTGGVANNTGGVANNTVKGDGNSSTMYIIIIVVVCIIIIAVAAYFFSQSRNNPPQNDIGLPDSLTPSDENPIQIGGFIGLRESEMAEELMGGSKESYDNIYLWALIAVLIYFIYVKVLLELSSA